MEKNQYELCLEILRRFSQNGILDNLILIGSWCIFFYQDYFTDVSYVAQISLKTRDIDFLINNPRTIKHTVNIPALLQDLGFVISFKGSEGYIKLDHPDLILEFLTPEKGRGSDKPYPLPKLGLNATPLRFLDFLSVNTIKVKVEDFYLTLPHPVNFALHKLILFQRRTNKEKAVKDRIMATEILKILIKKGELRIIKNVFDSVPVNWQKKIVTGLKIAEEQELLKFLK